MAAQQQSLLNVQSNLANVIKNIESNLFTKIQRLENNVIDKIDSSSSNKKPDPSTELYDIWRWDLMGEALNFTEPTHDLASFAKQVGLKILTGDKANYVCCLHRLTSSARIPDKIVDRIKRQLALFDEWESSFENGDRTTLLIANIPPREGGDYYELFTVEFVQDWTLHANLIASPASFKSFLQTRGEEFLDLYEYADSRILETIFIGRDFTETAIAPNTVTFESLLSDADRDVLVTSARSSPGLADIPIENVITLYNNLNHLTRFTSLLDTPYVLVVDADTGIIEYRQNAGPSGVGIDYR